ncbi:MAG: hypothetical protein AAGA95_15695 [Pseudomonadota bacterium]
MADQSVLLAYETSAHDPRPFFLYPEERTNHVLFLGMRTPGQRQVLLNLIAQDIDRGAGLAILDTTGHYARSTLDLVPPHRAHHTYYVCPHDPNHVVGFNPFRGVPTAQKALASQQIMEVFKDIWSLDYDRTPLLIDLLRSASRLLLDSQDGTMLGMYAALTNGQYRASLVAQCTDSLTRSFWEKEFGAWPLRDQRDKPQPVLTRLRAFLSDPLLRNVLGQVNGALDLERVVRERQVLVANLDRTTLGSESARLLSCLLATRLRTALEARPSGWPFYLYLPALDQVHVGIGGRLLSGRYAAAGVVAGINALDGLTSNDRANVLSAEKLVSFRLALDDVRYVAPRFRIPQPEVNLPQLGIERLAVSGHLHELALADVQHRRWRQAHGIKQRSIEALTAPRRVVEKRIDRFIKRF